MPRKTLLCVAGVALLVGAAFRAAGEGHSTYDVAATAIEACSCPLFCSCYYNPEPSGGHHCEFNLAYRFDEGSRWGDVDLSGAKVWVSGDLGDHFGDGTTEWAMVTFDKATTPEQREAINGWIGRMFPVEWEKVEVRDDEISWDNGTEVAHAAMASGMAEVTLNKVLDAEGNQATVLNTRYWNSDSNNGFLLAHSTHHYDGEPSYSYDNHNGFVITSRVTGTIE